MQHEDILCFSAWESMATAGNHLVGFCLFIDDSHNSAVPHCIQLKSSHLCSPLARMVRQSCDVSKQSAHLLILTITVSRIWVICLSLSWMKRLPSGQITTATTHYTKQWLANIPTYFQRNIKPNSRVHTLHSLCAQMFPLQDCAGIQRQHCFIIHDGE